MSNLRSRSASFLPAFLASLMPCSESPMSYQPVNRFLRFHSLWPWRTRTSVPDIRSSWGSGDVEEDGSVTHKGRHGGCRAESWLNDGTCPFCNSLDAGAAPYPVP